MSTWFCAHLLVATDTTASSSAGVTRLHLKHCPEQVLRRRRQELDLGVRMKSVEVGALWRQDLVDESVVADVVAVWWHGKSGRQVQLAVHLITYTCSPLHRINSVFMSHYLSSPSEKS